MRLLGRFFIFSLVSTYAVAFLTSCAGEDAGSSSPLGTFTAAGGFIEHVPGDLRPTPGVQRSYAHSFRRPGEISFPHPTIPRPSASPTHRIAEARTA